MISRASPESRAETTNNGAIRALCQLTRAICSPKIQAVTEWTITAAGRATADKKASLRLSGAGRVICQR